MTCEGILEYFFVITIPVPGHPEIIRMLELTL